MYIGSVIAIPPAEPSVPESSPLEVETTKKHKLPGYYEIPAE
jgi:hypothetical protein